MSADRAWIRDARIVSVVVAMLALAFLGSRGLWDPDEGRYTNVALNMLARGDWLIPHRSLEVAHWTKPPLAYWGIATSFAVFGLNTWAARLTSALAYVLSAWLVGRIARRLGFGPAPWAALVFAVMLLPAVASQLVTTDMLLAACELIAMWGYVERRWGDGRLRWVVLMYAGFALAFLAKGPPGLLPALAIVATELAAPQPRRMLSATGLLAFAAIALPWFIAVVAAVPGLLGYFLGHEVVNRVASNDFGRHGEWYGWLVVYVPTLLVGTLPWTWPAVRGFVDIGRNARTWRTADVRRRDAQLVLLMAWTGLPLIVFCIARSRLPLYVLPLMAPIALVVARRLDRTDRVPVRALVAWCITLLLLRAVGAWIPSTQDARAFAAALRERAPRQVTEVVFVDDVPRYGLRLHLGAHVENVGLANAGAATSVNPDVDESLDRELGDAASPQALWITPAGRWPAVRTHLEARGFDATALGTPLQGRIVFRVLPARAVPAPH
ncbi:glycosyltransferase family 39 protein [Cognatilysobacter segetis]|uniref:glycosyltransferase family 39 protein n=1 Tax=Cognatilysobacter segetis TaxID=2492394 RepID=UPI00105D9FB1|nr:glycosyltransferase family 39 protein [Lysobacter segetis]